MAPEVVDIRLMITNFGQCGESDSPTHKSIHDAIRLHAGQSDHFKIVDRPDEEFQRAAACNILHDIAATSLYFLSLTDMIGPSVLRTFACVCGEGLVRVLSYSLVAFQP